MVRLALVRHGQTDWNLAGRVQGSSDIELNDTGRSQATDAGHVLAQRGYRWSVLMSSALLRARETAERIGTVIGLDYAGALPAFAERRYGQAEGLLSEQIRARFGAIDRAPGIEPRDAVIERAFRAALELGAEYPAGTGIIVVSHGGVIGSLIRHLSDWNLPAPGDYIRNGGVYEFESDGSSLTLVSYPNDPDAIEGMPLSRTL